MNVDRWLAIFGIFVGVLGIVIGFTVACYFYRKTIQGKVLAIAYTAPVSLMLPVADLKANYNGREIRQLSRVWVLLWNKGTLPIEESDFIAPIKIRSKEQVLSFTIDTKDAAADIGMDEAEKKIRVKLLRPGEAVVLKIDAADEAYQPDISVQMKSADMSTFIRARRIEWSFVAGVAVFILGNVMIGGIGLVAQNGSALLFSGILVMILGGVLLIGRPAAVTRRLGPVLN